MQHARRKIWYNIRNMSGEMHMWRRMDAKVRYSTAYPTGRERFCRQDMLTVDMSSAAIFFSHGVGGKCDSHLRRYLLVS